MARHFIHYYFSQNLTENASYALSAIFKLYPDAYLLGRLGADLFPTEHKARLAAADPIQLFGVTARHIFTSGSKCKLSYMLGLLSHYALDRILNPYLSYFAANGVAGYFGGKVETISREEIEIGVDRPNRATIKAMKEGDKLIEKYMKDPSSVKTYSTVEEAMEAMLK